MDAKDMPPFPVPPLTLAVSECLTGAPVRYDGRHKREAMPHAALDDLYERVGQRPEDPMSAIFVAAMREWRRSTERGALGGDSRLTLTGRIDRVMEIALARELHHLERYMTFLASVGSTAPFIGLFGTVWGIMNSFRSLANMSQATLASVAPGVTSTPCSGSTSMS